uniref:Uncharacterized protein n=1 Tax=Arundo donax TaxID=35708 RepID=A0A0A9BJA4_ARUDO
MAGRRRLRGERQACGERKCLDRCQCVLA